MTKKSNVFDGMTGPQLCVAAFVLILLVFGFLAFKSWLLGIILGWFGIHLGFWKDLLIILLLDFIIGGSVSKKWSTCSQLLIFNYVHYTYHCCCLVFFWLHFYGSYDENCISKSQRFVWSNERVMSYFFIYLIFLGIALFLNYAFHFNNKDWNYYEHRTLCRRSFCILGLCKSFLWW